MCKLLPQPDPELGYNPLADASATVVTDTTGASFYSTSVLAGSAAFLTHHNIDNNNNYNDNNNNNNSNNNGNRCISCNVNGCDFRCPQETSSSDSRPNS